MNISVKYRKLITSLRYKKYREQHQLFVAEGKKTVNEFLNSCFALEKLFTTDPLSFDVDRQKVVSISKGELARLSGLKSPDGVLGIFRIPDEKKLDLKGLTLALDTVNDPGNLGTIIRLCDWFGVCQIVCSKTTVDCYNPKVIQATMGSLKRVSVHYLDLYSLLKSTQIPVFIASMGGKNVYKTDLPKDAILVMGNEANGVCSQIKKLINSEICIPAFGNYKQAESLNVATATAILLSEFRRD